MTKPVTAAAVMMLVERGKIDLPRIWEYSPIVLDAKSGLCQRIALQSFRLHTIRPS